MVGDGGVVVIVHGGMVSPMVLRPPSCHCTAMEDGGDGAWWAWHGVDVYGCLVHSAYDAHLGLCTTGGVVWVALD